MVGLAMALFIIANVGFAGGNVFIDSFLPGIANESNAGRLSGLKYGVGYMSGLIAVILACRSSPRASTRRHRSWSTGLG